MTAGSYVGALVGYQNQDSTISGCFTKGSVVG